MFIKHGPPNQWVDGSIFLLPGAVYDILIPTPISILMLVVFVTGLFNSVEKSFGG